MVRIGLLRLPEVRRLTGLSRSSIYRLEAISGFPARVRLSERATAWRADEVLAWVEARPRESGTRSSAVAFADGGKSREPVA
jgi:prophage regulatory protein